MAADFAYENLAREVAGIKAHFGSMGHFLSTDLGETVKQAVLQRFDIVLKAFEHAYLDKWREDSRRPFTDEDLAWLNLQVTSQLEPRVVDAEGKCNAYLWERSLYYARYWEQTGVLARQRVAKVRKSIELLQLQKRESPSRLTPLTPPLRGEDHPLGDLTIPNNAKAAALLNELQSCYRAECWNACGILIGVLIERALDV